MATTLSKKKEDLLYSTIHESIMNSRLEIITLLNKKSLPTEDIDLILYKLCASTPKKALRCFEKSKLINPYNK